MKQLNGPGFDRQDVEILDQQRVYDGFFKMERYQLRHRLFAGGWSDTITRECFERGAAVGALLYDPQRDAVVLLQQFRIGTLAQEPWQIELVAGIVEEGETPEQVVRREAVEEAGCEPGQLEFICEYFPSPGGSSEKLYLYCGAVDSRGLGGVYGLPEEGEDILVQVCPREQAWQRLQQHRINNAATIIALQWLQMNYLQLQERWRQAE